VSAVTPPQAASAAATANGASAPEAASGAETPPLDLNGGPETTQIPAGQLVPPTRFNLPSFKLR
jgi:phospholipid-binding lipoprotein MlaA